MTHSIPSAASLGPAPFLKAPSGRKSETVDPACQCPQTMLWLLQTPGARTALTQGPVRSPSPCPRPRGPAGGGQLLWSRRAARAPGKRGVAGRCRLPL